MEDFIRGTKTPSKHLLGMTITNHTEVTLSENNIRLKTLHLKLNKIYNKQPIDSPFSTLE